MKDFHYAYTNILLYLVTHYFSSSKLMTWSHTHKDCSFILPLDVVVFILVAESVIPVLDWA